MDIPSHFKDWDARSAASSEVLKTEITPTKPPNRRRWFIIAATLASIAFVISMVVSLAVVLPRQKNQNTTILLPLYIYPENNSTWAPLYNAAASHPNVKFVVIINPSSGPGSSNYPNDQYTAAVSQLSRYPNVEMVGYVRTGYASRSLSDVVSEVSTYAGWGSKNPSLAMRGIFFDESPHEFSENAVNFMRTATKAAKDAQGLLGSKMVIRNPGVIPDGRFDDGNTDISVVFEESHNQYWPLKRNLDALPKDRSHVAYMMHSMPWMTRDQLQKLAGELSQHAEYLFMTNNNNNYYESFGSNWADFTGVVMG